MITFPKSSLRPLMWVLLMLLLPVVAAAAPRKVTGTVFEEDGITPLPGATVMQKGRTQSAVMTNLDGVFDVSVTGKTPVIEISFIGYDKQQVTVDSNKPIKIVMKPNAVQLNDVAVTALGITREQKSLGYAVTKVSSEDLTNTVSGNWLSAMNGKVAGLTIDGAATGPMGSMRVVLRGDQSLNYGANEALFVVDGVPISSGTTATNSGSNYGNEDAPVDFGNDAADINPEDVESVTVLKGPAATALYGSRAANGAIVITTKSGRKDKGIGVTVNSSVTWEKAGYFPDFQKEYGPGSDHGARPYSQWNIKADNNTAGYQVYRNYSMHCWGAKYDENLMSYPYDSYNWETGMYTPLPFVYQDDWYTGLFRTGVTYNNNVTVDGNNGKGTSGRLSVTDTRNDWVMPNTGYKKNTVSASFSTKLNKWVTVRANMNYYNKRSDNVPMSGYSSNTATYMLGWCLPVNAFRCLEDEYRFGRLNYDNYTNQRLVRPNANTMSNPLRFLYEHLNTINKNRMVGNASVNVKFPVKGLTLTVRGAMDMNMEFRTQRRAILSSGYPNGGYKEQSIQKTESNIDFLLRYENNRWLNKQLSFNISFGGNHMDNHYYTEYINLKDLEIPGVYNVNNAPANSIPTPYHYRSHKVVNSFYAFTSLGWKGTYYLDLTARNDWSSSLARGNWSFFYPSVAASVLFDEVFHLHETATWVDLLKLRLSWANVGNDTSAYALTDMYATTSFTGGVQLPSIVANPRIKPENVESWEAGVEARFLGNRIGLDAAIYTSSTTNQIVSAKVEAMAGATGMRINAGEIRNQGIELAAHFQPIRTRDWDWSIDVNWTKNVSKLISLQDDWDPATPLQTSMGTTIENNIYCYSYVGGVMNKLYGIGYRRAAEGAYILNEDGTKTPCAGQKIINEADGHPLLTTDPSVYLGKVNPDFQAGLTTRLRWKQISLNASFSAQVGGVCYSATNGVLSYSGRLTNSLEGRPGGMVVEGVCEAGVDAEGNTIYKKNRTIIDKIDNYYANVKWARLNAEENTFSTDYLKLREVRVDYALPRVICKRTKVLQSASIGAYATNLFCISSWPQYDPETGTLAGTDIHRGIETGAMPMTRTYGVNIKLAF